MHRVQGAVATWVKTGENPAAARRAQELNDAGVERSTCLGGTPYSHRQMREELLHPLSPASGLGPSRLLPDGNLEGQRAPDRKRRALHQAVELVVMELADSDDESVPKTGQNRRTSRPHLALRGTTWHNPPPTYTRVHARSKDLWDRHVVHPGPDVVTDAGLRVEEVRGSLDQVGVYVVVVPVDWKSRRGLRHQRGSTVSDGSCHVQISAVAHDHGECHESDGKSAAKNGTKRGTRRH